MKTIKLFGVDIQVKQHDHQDTITTNNEASRERKLSPNQEEDDDDSFIPNKPKLLRLYDDGEEGEEAVPSSEFHPVSVTTDDAISGKRKLATPSPNQEEDDDSFIPKKPKLLRLIDDGEEVMLFGKYVHADDHLSRSPTDDNDTITMDETSRKRKLTTTSPNQEDDLSLGLPTASSTQEDQPAMQNPNQEDHAAIQNPNQEDHVAIQNPNQEDQAAIQNPNQEDQAAIQNPNQEAVVNVEEEEEAPDPPEGNLVFMFEKKLTSSDVARNHNRLLITKRNSLMAALTEEERERVEVNGGDNLRVVTTDPNGAEYILKLKRWAGSGALVLIHEWGKLVRANGFESGEFIQGWGYRIDDEFRLFLHIIRNQFN